MPGLERIQRTMMCAIAQGPDQVPDDLFAGRRGAALRGLSVHVNTISHARLVALEETFPRTRAILGEAAFNALSRDYIESPSICGLTLTAIGQHFVGWLEADEQAQAAIDLARFEWAWLQSYHAVEAAAFSIVELANLSEAGIADLVLTRHSASTVMRLDAQVRQVLASETDAPFTGEHVLITRPEAEVRVLSLSHQGAALHAALANPQTICNLLTEADEPDSQDAVLALIESGALVRIEKVRAC